MSEIIPRHTVRTVSFPDLRRRTRADLPPPPCATGADEPTPAPRRPHPGPHPGPHPALPGPHQAGVTVIVTLGQPAARLARRAFSALSTLSRQRVLSATHSPT